MLSLTNTGWILISFIITISLIAAIKETRFEFAREICNTDIFPIYLPYSGLTFGIIKITGIYTNCMGSITKRIKLQMSIRRMTNAASVMTQIYDYVFNTTEY